MSEIFIGVDGGGTHTRAIAITSTGEIVGRAQTAGSNPEFNSGARHNTQSAIQQVVAEAGTDYYGNGQGGISVGAVSLRRGS